METNSNSPTRKPFYLTARASTDEQTDGQGDSSITPLTSLRGCNKVKITKSVVADALETELVAPPPYRECGS